jgi:SPP1 family predicted phage head-tail adaptor
MLYAGLLNKIITIQSKTQTTDEYGGPVTTWATYKQVWAAIWPLRGRELIAAQAAQSETAVRFRIRYLAGLTSAMRISCDGKIYDITGIVDFEEKHVEMDIMTKTGVSEG